MAIAIAPTLIDTLSSNINNSNTQYAVPENMKGRSYEEGTSNDWANVGDTSTNGDGGSHNGGEDDLLGDRRRFRKTRQDDDDDNIDDYEDVDMADFRPRGLLGDWTAKRAALEKVAAGPPASASANTLPSFFTRTRHSIKRRGNSFIKTLMEEQVGQGETVPDFKDFVVDDEELGVEEEGDMEEKNLKLKTLLSELEVENRERTLEIDTLRSERERLFKDIHAEHERHLRFFSIRETNKEENSRILSTMDRVADEIGSMRKGIETMHDHVKKMKRELRARTAPSSSSSVSSSSSRTSTRRRTRRNSLMSTASTVERDMEASLDDEHGYADRGSLDHR